MSVKFDYNGYEYFDEIVAGAAMLDMTHAMVGETLSVDTLSVPLMTEDIPVRFLADDQDEDDFFYTADDKIFCAFDGSSTPVYVKNGVGRLYFGEDLIGAYYLDELTQSGLTERIMRFLSGIRLLDRSDHQGGLYSGELAGDVIDDIISNIVPYTIDADIAEIPVYGYLPYARRRNNLQFVLMAISAAVRNNPDGSLRIAQLSDTVTGAIDESRVFFGGSVVNRTPATAVQVTEHNYLPSDDEVVLYDGVSIGTETIKFSEPIHDLDITGGTILASGVNFCIFQGAGAVLLKGKRYNHVTRIITVGTPPTGIESDVVKKVTNNTLLGPSNAVFVAEKLYDYLTVAQSIKQEVVLGSERPADVVQVVHPYTRQIIEACIKSMRITFGRNEHRALCEFLVGYKPPGATAGFENHALLTDSGTWTVPAGVTRIRIILVGAGGGGKKGGNGTAPSSRTTGLPAVVGQGGKGGDGGEGGFILEVNISVTPGQQFSFSCGAGGASDTEGGTTLFGGYTSVMGRRYPYGYSEPKTGLVLGEKGVNGVDGRPGNQWQEAGEPLEYNGTTYYPGQNGDNYHNPEIYGGYGHGGGGGGAAVGSNGGNGTDASALPGGSTFYFIHGNGGNGANAAPGEDATEYGAGGNGGHGGGGGGYAIGDLPGINDLVGIVGQGGSGGSGGKGGDGCIIVYY